MVVCVTGCKRSATDFPPSNLRAISSFNLEFYHNSQANIHVTHKDENAWWYDGEMVEFRTPNYAKILRMMQTRPALTQEEVREELGISITAIAKLTGQLIDKNYVEKDANGSWRVFINPSV